MHRHILIVLAAIISTYRPAAAADYVCPVLPINSGVEWHIDRGPDFDVCHAVRVSDKEELFGVYLGNHPWFKPIPNTVEINGVVGGKKIKWHFNPRPSGENSAWEAVLVLSAPHPQLPVMAHVWLQPLNRDNTLRALSLVGQMRFHTPNNGP